MSNKASQEKNPLVEMAKDNIFLLLAGPKLLCRKGIIMFSHQGGRDIQYYAWPGSMEKKLLFTARPSEGTLVSNFWDRTKINPNYHIYHTKEGALRDSRGDGPPRQINYPKYLQLVKHALPWDFRERLVRLLDAPVWYSDYSNPLAGNPILDLIGHA
jgi:hypothetical protein